MLIVNIKNVLCMIGTALNVCFIYSLQEPHEVGTILLLIVH